MANLFEPLANWRRTDPATSKDAAIGTEKDGKAATWRARCLQAVRERPGLTAGEYADWLQVERTTFGRRLPELEQLGYVRKGAPRPCNVSHVKGHTWWPTEGKA
jgi:hypothetical protein